MDTSYCIFLYMYIIELGMQIGDYPLAVFYRRQLFMDFDGR